MHRPNRATDGLTGLRVAVVVLAGLLAVILAAGFVHAQRGTERPHAPTTPADLPTPTRPAAAPASVHYSSCTEARNAGIPLPIPADHPAYRPELDRNGNQLACE